MRVLLVVEPRFLEEHVGVRRVILYWWKCFTSAGHSVSVATPDSNVLLAGEARPLAALLAPTSGEDTPTWTSSSRRAPRFMDVPRGAPPKVTWSREQVTPSDFDVSILTNPWLCQLGLPRTDFTIGIVHDAVPNLIAAGCLRLPHADNVWAFAKAHDIGFRTFRNHCERIACVSESTSRDFEALYPTRATSQRSFVAFPFADDAIEAVDSNVSSGRTVLLVNALDPRKNPHGMAAAIAAVSAVSPLSVVVVGRQRISFSDALGVLGAMSDAGAEVTWYRNASDSLLDQLYRTSSVLLFNSFYEGLGLPILEAQARGLPAVTSNTSSCLECNLNPELAVDPFDPGKLAERLLDTLYARRPILRGNALRAAQQRLLAGRNNLAQLLGLNAPS